MEDNVVKFAPIDLLEDFYLYLNNIKSEEKQTTEFTGSVFDDLGLNDDQPTEDTTITDFDLGYITAAIDRGCSIGISKSSSKYSVSHKIETFRYTPRIEFSCRYVAYANKLQSICDKLGVRTLPGGKKGRKKHPDGKSYDYTTPILTVSGYENIIKFTAYFKDRVVVTRLQLDLLHRFCKAFEPVKPGNPQLYNDEMHRCYAKLKAYTSERSPQRKAKLKT